MDETVNTKLIEDTCHVETTRDIREAGRVQVGDDKYYSQRYTKLKTKACAIVLCLNGDMVIINIFLVTSTNDVYLYGTKLHVDTPAYLFVEAGNHILCVTDQPTVEVIYLVSQLQEKLCFMNIAPWIVKGPSPYTMFCHRLYTNTLRNKGSFDAFKEPLGFFG